MNPLLSFLTNLQSKFLKWRVNREIFERVFSHLEQEKDYGYPFKTDAQLEAVTDNLNVQELLREAEECIARMPAAYGRSFRYIMHRDLRRQVLQYHLLAKWEGRARINPTVYASKA